MATNEADVVTWTVHCRTCQKVVQEGTGTPPARVEDLVGADRAKVSGHVQEAGGGQHQLELRRRGRVTEAQADFYL